MGPFFHINNLVRKFRQTEIIKKIKNYLGVDEYMTTKHLFFFLKLFRIFMSSHKIWWVIRHVLTYIVYTTCNRIKTTYIYAKFYSDKLQI